MSDISIHILSGLAISVPIVAIVIIIVSSSQHARQKGRNYDLCRLLGIALLLAGLAAQNYAVSILGSIFLISGFANKIMLLMKKHP